MAPSTSAWGQLYSGSLTGVVTDPTGAVIPGVKVTLTDVGKGYTYPVTTDAVGRYLIRPLPPSTYKLLVEAQGFKSSVQDGIVLDVKQNATVDVKLELGTTAQSVEVTGAPPVMATQDAVTGQAINRTFINDLPLISRAVYDLAYLTPGVNPSYGRTFGPISSAGNNFTSNGGRNATADVLLDGVSTTNYEQNSGIQVPIYTPSVDAVQEFKVQQNNFTAEIGYSGNTVVNVVMRSGTNTFHGSAYEFLRNQVMDSNNWFDNANGVKIPPLRLNNFGFTVGGPIQKDKMFFFVDYEGSRERSLSGGRNAGVPSALERTGDFGELCPAGFDDSGLCTSPDGEGQLWDPYSGVYDENEGGPVRQLYIPYNNLATYQSPGNPGLVDSPYGQLAATPGNLIDPIAVKMMSFFPLPNKGVGTPDYNRFNNWYGGTGVNKNDNNQWDFRIDRRFGDKNQLAARFSIGRNNSHGPQCFPNALDPCSQGPNSGGPTAFVLNDTHTFTPTTVMTLSYGVTRSWSWTKGSGADMPNWDPVTELGLPSYLMTSGFKTSPDIMIYGGYQAAGGDGSSSIGAQPWSIMRYGQETHHLIGSLNHIRGRHDLKFGGEMRVHRINFIQPGVPQGWFMYDYNSTSQMPYSGYGDAMAGFLMGIGPPGAWGEYEIPAAVSTQNIQIGEYVQDNWRVTDKLTLNLGIRYDIDFPRTERHNRAEWIDLNVPSPLQGVPGFPDLKGGIVFASPNSRHVVETDYGNIGPRIGFAYRLTPTTVIRGGYGIYYSLSQYGAAGTGPGGLTGFDGVTGWPTARPGQPSTPWGMLRNPFPNGLVLPLGSTLGLLTNIGQGISGPARNGNIMPSMQTWSFGLQHEFPGRFLVDASYVGTKGTHLYFAGGGELNHHGPWIETATPAQIADLNTYVPNPFFGIITDPTSNLSADTIDQGQLLLPYPQYTGVTLFPPAVANSIYHAFQLRVEKRFSQGLQMLLNYTNSKAIDDASMSTYTGWMGGFSSLVDPNNRKLERSVSEFDIPQVLAIGYVYQLPFGRGKKWGTHLNPWIDGFLGGWQTNGFWRFDNGQPISLQVSGAHNLPSYGAGDRGSRPNLLAPLRRNNGSDWMANYFANPEVLAVPPAYTVPTAPRMLPNVRVPGTSTAALSLFKEIPLNKIREGTRLEFRAETFNAFNHPQFCGPDTTFNTDNFGQVTSQCNSPREVQLALKFYF